MGSPASQVGGPYEIDIDVDEKNPDAYVVLLSQSGLGMPDRDYYLLQDKDIVATREAYQKYLADMLALAGVTRRRAQCRGVCARGEDRRTCTGRRRDRRDADKIYNPHDLPARSDLRAAIPMGRLLLRGRRPADLTEG